MTKSAGLTAAVLLWGAAAQADFHIVLGVYHELRCLVCDQSNTGNSGGRGA